MKRILPIILLITIMTNTPTYGQVESMPVSEECFDLTRKDKEYFIRLNAIDYLDKDKAFLCESNFPGAIEILYNLPGNPLDKTPVAGLNWDWTNCNCQNPDANSNSNIIEFGNLNGDKVTMKVKFIENGYVEELGKKKELRLKIYHLTSLNINDIDTYMQSEYSYDDNRSFNNYPDHAAMVPYKFLPFDEDDILIFKGHENILKQEILSSNPNLINFNSNENQMTLDYFGQNNNDNIITSLCENQGLFNIDVYPRHNITVDLFRLQESDDDEANYCLENNRLQIDCVTPISSPDHVCIDPGNDGTLDLYRNLQSWVSSDDSIVADKSVAAQVLAGKNHRCNTSPRDNNLTNFNYNWVNSAQIQNHLNTIYGKLGIDFTVIDHGDMPFNFDVHEDDGKVNTTFNGPSAREDKEIHIQLFGPNVNVFPDNPQIWLVPELYKTKNNKIQKLKGTAIRDNSRTVVVSKDMIDRTISHEIGHAYFMLHHPDEGDGNETGHLEDGMQNPVNNDKYNFMNSGHLDGTTVTDIDRFRIRRYQWDIIQRNI